MQMRKLIGLLGVKGAGKDTAANFLVEKHGFRRIAFGDRVYAELAEAFGVTVEFLGNRETKETPLAELALQNCAESSFVTCVLGLLRAQHETLERTGAFDRDAALRAPRSPRVLLQWWGTEYRRTHVRDTYWVDIVEQALRDNPGQSFVVTDVRMTNEVALVRRMGGVLMRVRRPGLEEKEAAARASAAMTTAAHCSETALLNSPVDAEVFNLEGSPERLHSDICSAAERFRLF